MKLKKSANDTRRVANVAVNAATLIAESLLRKRIISAPTKGRKITVESIGNPRGFIVRYGDIVLFLHNH